MWFPTCENNHCHIDEIARSFILTALVLSEFWEEAILTVVYAINRITSSIILGLSLFQLYASTPTYSSLKVFGLLVLYVVHK